VADQNGRLAVKFSSALDKLTLIPFSFPEIVPDVFGKGHDIYAQC